MASEPADSSSLPTATAPNVQGSAKQEASARDAPSILSTSGIASWARNLKISQPSAQDESQSGNSAKSTFTRFTSGISFRMSPKSPAQDVTAAALESTSPAAQPGVLGSLTKGLVDSSRSAVKAVQVKARHIVSQNKRRYQVPDFQVALQEGGFDLDMTYITENIIAMGFPAGDMSSGFFGYVEGFYRNHMEEVIKFFETHHKGKYKVYNLCSERLYDASLFEGKEDIENVVVVHCKAGMARTGLMISSLLLFLKFFPTAEESIEYYNQKRCLDGKGLVLPSQIVSTPRYVKYFERILTYFNGENQSGRSHIVVFHVVSLLPFIAIFDSTDCPVFAIGFLGGFMSVLQLESVKQRTQFCLFMGNIIRELPSNIIKRWVVLVGSAEETIATGSHRQVERWVGPVGSVEEMVVRDWQSQSRWEATQRRRQCGIGSRREKETGSNAKEMTMRDQQSQTRRARSG
ncbi:Phosphatidylinositol 3,4,5-trisphosphate 3-phosphatase and protein-tyrosine-phosphatase pten2a [Asimina triloba]